MMRQPARRAEQGFTLIELMIALTLFSVAVAGILSVAVTITNGYREQRQAMAAEAAVRAPLDFLADAIRQASPGMTDWSKVTDFHSCVAGAITVVDRADGPDELDLFYATGGVLTATRTDYSGTGALDVHDTTGLVVGDYVIVTDTDRGFLAKITGLTATQLTFATKCSYPIDTPFPPGSLVIRAQHARFTVDPGGGSYPHPTLLMDPDGAPAAAGGLELPEPLAEGIEDMQIALGVETDGNPGLTEVGSVAGDDEWIFNVAGETAPLPGTVIRAVRITLIARTNSQLLGNTSTFFNRPKAENRPAGGNDNFRRRVLTTTIELRNISGSP